jgi:hypothetical protein
VTLFSPLLGGNASELTKVDASGEPPQATYQPLPFKQECHPDLKFDPRPSGGGKGFQIFATLPPRRSASRLRTDSKASARLTHRSPSDPTGANTAPFKRNDALLEALSTGVLVFPGNGVKNNLTEKTRKLGRPAWKIARMKRCDARRRSCASLDVSRAIVHSTTGDQNMSMRCGMPFFDSRRQQS